MCDVLVVDDDSLVRETLVALLEEEGWNVVGVDGYDTALAAIRQDNGCRLLVTDINLGTPADGFEVAASIRRLRPDLPVLYITGRPWVFWGREFHERERALSKPFRADQLLQTVGELITAER
ncbi:response regulator [Roseomonas elaeocarpi]|uniref:Response regulator n=1 Tax=Roseomonas elaeocarpi TaxID=907779 RepID=A0ABV6JT59_9PROT